MPKPEKKRRNEEIYTRKMQGWTFEQLKEHYGISRPTLFDIVKREEKRREKAEIKQKCE